MSLTFEPVNNKTIHSYVATGIASYNEHYLHLWQDEDPTAFFEENLTQEVVKKAIQDPDQKLFIIYEENSAVGILKLTLDSDPYGFLPSKNVLLNKIYLLKAFSGRGIGKKALDFVVQFTERNKKKAIWLYTMKKGQALNFYQKNGFTIVKEVVLQLPGVKTAESEMWLLTKEL